MRKVLGFVLIFLLMVVGVTACNKTANNENVTISLSQTSVQMSVDEYERVTASVQPTDAEDKKIEWKSSDESVAKVDNGMIHAISQGQATITATTNDSTSSCEVYVNDTSTAKTDK